MTIPPPVEGAVAVPEIGSVSSLLLRPAEAHVMLVLAHGAGSGMRHPFMTSVATHLAAHGVATLRYQFPYVETDRKRPDAPRVATATVRAAAAAARRAAPELPLFAGGKSFGGRMTSTAQAEAPLPSVRGLVVLGFPLHAPKRPGVERAAHLERIALPMLFVQGTRDPFADLTLLRPLSGQLADASVHEVADGDHSLAVPKRTGRDPQEVLGEVAEVVAAWMAARSSGAEGQWSVTSVSEAVKRAGGPRSGRQ